MLVNPKVINSANIPVVLWLEDEAHELRYDWWTGIEWFGSDDIGTDVRAFDVAVVPGGFHLLWRDGNGDVFIGKFAGRKIVSAPYQFATTVGDGATGRVAINAAPDGHIGVLFETGVGLLMKLFSPAGLELAVTTLDLATEFEGGITIASRGLTDLNGRYRWVVHASTGAETGVRIFHVEHSGGTLNFTDNARMNSTIASKSFRVGDEVFCWLRANNSGTNYLFGGVGRGQISGIADREEAVDRAGSLPHVLPDPRSDTKFTWARPFNTGQTYVRGGNVRVGDLDFLPNISTARFGRSVYLSGSHVRNFDGVTVGDAGFHDYPFIDDALAENTSDGGATWDPVDLSLVLIGPVYWRVYPVRYNARGERFQGASLPFTVNIGTNVFGDTLSQFRVGLTIRTVPVTNHDDVMFEVYRTEKDGTTFYFEGVVANDLTAPTVTYISTMSDVDLIKQTADSHHAGVGVLSEIEEWGPIGCGILAVSGDRMWGAGGQIPGGLTQFSKLKEEGEGAGFDALAGYQVVDTEGRAITSIAALNDITAVWMRERLMVIAGTGPDNYGRGAFTIPQILLADGAITHAGTVITQLGVLFYGVDGPRLLTTQLSVENISAAIRPLAQSLVPTGVRANLSKHEIVWYTADGNALLWNYLSGSSRWAQWTGLYVAGCSDSGVLTTDGRMLYESPDAAGDGGQPFAFTIMSSNLRAEDVMQGATQINKVGVVGVHRGPHRLRTRVYYNGSPLWTKRDWWEWQPEDDTWLSSGVNFMELTPAQIDALTNKSRSGVYIMHWRTSRHTCHFFRVELSTVEAAGPTFTPYELSLELGVRGGMGRVPGG
jgi:hypothetical protein